MKYEIIVPECLQIIRQNPKVPIYYKFNHSDLCTKCYQQMHFLGEKAFIFNLRSDVKMKKENVHQI